MEEVECGIEKKAAAMAAAEEVGRKEEAAASDVGLKELSRKLNDFAKARDWEQYHSPRNLLLAMVRKGLADWDEAEKEHLGEELADVLLYLVRLSDICGVDLGDAATRKIVKNAAKYPAPSKEGA
ncbi:dCTP pyrophosphatase 1-like [Panicum miliaceum]|uniref:dCTP pyrophosphatase 1 n=1 Tax=Panicum miliaceum TaxID=4540 RepID=A0A3L6PRM0_PANMI|nr:dCTP pyrophosphatase 1-like [Panicum miliaceum]